MEQDQVLSELQKLRAKIEQLEQHVVWFQSWGAIALGSLAFLLVFFYAADAAEYLFAGCIGGSLFILAIHLRTWYRLRERLRAN